MGDESFIKREFCINFMGFSRFSKYEERKFMPKKVEELIKMYPEVMLDIQ